jgi:hypothetical protein
MADSHFIKLRIEPAMRERLAVAFGVRFLERAMPIRWNGEGTGLFRFDAVSEDGTIIACLSTARNLKTGQRNKLMRDATFMWLTPGAKHRILAVVEARVADALNVELHCGRLPPRTEIRIIDLAPEMRQELENFRMIAANEVGTTEF